MSVQDNTRIAVRVCRMYYLEDLSQKTIASKLGISRPQISRILSSARKDKLVSISINDPFEEESKLQDSIRKMYAVQDVFVFDVSASPEQTKLDDFGQIAASYLELFIKNKSTVGVMSGRTVDSTVRGIVNFSRKGLEVVPLVGGLGALNPNWHANTIALSLAQKSSGTSYALNAPIIVSDPKIRDMFIKEPEIKSVLDKGKQCNTIIVGIGDVSEKSTNIKAGGLNSQDVSQLQQAGAVASACCSYLDRNGNILNLEIENRYIGQKLQDLQQSTIIALAYGQRKLTAIQSLLRSKILDVLMTDLETARLLVADGVQADG